MQVGHHRDAAQGQDRRGGRSQLVRVDDVGLEVPVSADGEPGDLRHRLRSRRPGGSEVDKGAVHADVGDLQTVAGEAPTQMERAQELTEGLIGIEIGDDQNSHRNQTTG